MTPVLLLVCLSFFYLVFQQFFRRAASHELVFLIFTLIFLALILTPVALLWLGAFLTTGYVLTAGAGRFRKLHPFFIVAPLVMLFAVFKRYDILPLQPLYAHIPELVGLSYIIFRVIMVVFEARESGQALGPVTYINFCLSPFTFLSGPIQRLRDFREDMARRHDFVLTEAEGAAAVTRFMNGTIKALFLGPFVQDFQFYFLHAADKATIVILLGGLSAAVGYGLAALCYLLFLYFNFSGYTDMVIGLGRLFGFRLPENFNNPFVSISFLDFWARWHISLSLWFRDYCFTPILKTMVKAGVNNPVLATLPAYFISFGLLGLWHGRTWPFILCGLMFAAGSVLNHLFRTIMTRKLSKDRQKKLNAYPAWQALAGAVTFFYIAIAITGLWLTGPEYIALWRSFGIARAVPAFGMVIIGLTAGLFMARILWPLPPIQKILVAPVRRFFESGSSFMIAVKIFMVIIWFFVFSTNLPDFVYRGF